MKGHYQLYNQSQIDFIYANYTKMLKTEILKVINKMGCEHTYSSLKAFYTKNKLVSGIDTKMKKGHVSPNKGLKMDKKTYEKVKPTMFNKGHKPWNTHKIGDRCRVKDKSGVYYWKQKVAEPDKWRFVAHLVWEENNGPIPEGHVITYLDGNADNYDISNLVCITRNELLQLSRFYKNFKTTEERQVCIDIIKTKSKIREIENERKQ